LENFVKNNGYEKNAAVALKSASGWLDDCNGDDVFEFNAKPAGNKDYVGLEYIGLGSQIYFWSSTTNVGEGVACRKFVYNSDEIKEIAGYKVDGYSIRCLKD